MKPGDLYISVVDLFSIFVPGAIFTALLLKGLHVVIAADLVLKGETAEWAAFLILSYLFGHLIYAGGALLDRRIYEWIRDRWFKDEPDCAFDRVTKLRNQMLNGNKNQPVNNFKWSKSVLLVKSPSGLSEVNKMEADSKFFRSLVILCWIVCFIAAVLAVAAVIDGISHNDKWWMAVVVVGATLVLSLLSLWRYADLRRKSTELAYVHAIIHLKLAAEGKPK